MLDKPVQKSTKLGILGLILVVAILFLIDCNPTVGAYNTQENSRANSTTNTIVPGVRVGDYKLGMSKDEVLKSLRKTEGDSLREAGNSISVDGVILNIIDDSVKSIDVLSPLYQFANGLRVGDSEQEFKQAFGFKFKFEEDQGKLYLTYKDEGLQFIIHKKNRTVMEISITKKISHKPRASFIKEIKSVSKFDNVSGKDLSKLDLSTRKGLIDTLGFDQKTVWPEQAKMPPGSNPKKILADAMNPGLGVRQLHRQGITGKGVNVAIIDQPLYMDHPEYSGKIVAYYDAGCGSSKNSMHGPAMASLLVGNQCGTAPGARVYYVAVPSWEMDAAYYANALDWIVMQNNALPVSEKIRVVSVSAQPSGAGSKYINQFLWDQAVQRAEENDVLVLDCTWHHGIVSVCWLQPQNRESVKFCTPGFRRDKVEIDKGHIHVPTAPRTVAQCYSEKAFGYSFDSGGSQSGRPMSKGGYSDSIPYAAGILAMGWQVNPELTPEQMRELLFKSAFTDKNGAKIIYPKKFISMAKIAKVAPRRNQQQGIYRENSKNNTIVPGVGVGDYKLGMSKNEVLKILRKTKGDSLNEAGNSISDDGVILNFIDDSVRRIDVLSDIYKFSNGLGIGSPEQKIKQTFGGNFLLKETEWKDYLVYENEGLQFEVHKKNRTIMEFTVTQKNARGHVDSLAEPIESVESYDDVRGKDLSKLGLSELKGLIATLRFNKKTIWPGRAESFADKLLNKAMNPGLGVRQLHQQGITGKGVNVAIIDQPTYLVHPEFAGKIVAYYDTGCETDESSMHGPGVAS
ncbi:MAG: S8 family peptidase, partial [Planctomycetota bacterium]